MYWASGASHGPHHVPKEWADKYKGKFDDGWDKYRERVFQRAKQMGWIPPDAQADAAARHAGFLGLDPRGREALPTPPDGGVRRILPSTSMYRSAASWMRSTARLRREHADLLHLGRQRRLGRRAERHDQRAAGAERHSDHHQAAHRGARRARRPRRARLAQDRQHVSRRLGLGGQHALSGDQAHRLAFRRHAQSDGGSLARKDQARRHAARAIPPRQRHRADHLRRPRHHAAARGQRHPAGSVRRRQLCQHLQRCEGQGGETHPVFRSHGQPRHLSRRLDGVRVWPARAVGSRLATRHQGMDAGQGQVGALQPQRGLVAGQRPRRQDAGEACRDEGPVSDRVHQEQGLAHRRRPVGSGAPP